MGTKQIKASKPTKIERIWELDFLCGLLILLMISYHLYYFVDEFCISRYNIDHYRWVEITDPLRFWFNWGEDGNIQMVFLPNNLLTTWMLSGQDAFFVLSGISCILSRNNRKNTIRLLIAGYAFTAFTFFLAKVTGNPAKYMRFGPLLCYAYCHLIYIIALEKRNNRAIAIVALIVLILGYVQRYLYPIHTQTILLFPFGYYPEGFLTGEFMPIFPMLGWMLFGVLLGRRFYSNKQSLFPQSVMNKPTKWIQWFGKHSGIVYLGHLLLLNAVFYGIGYIFELF